MKRYQMLLLISLLMSMNRISIIQAQIIQKPPVKRIENFREIMHGVEIIDPYRWLEDQQSPETRARIEEQNRYKHRLLDGLPYCDAFQKHFKELMLVDRSSTPLERHSVYSKKPFPYQEIGPNLYKIEVDDNSIIASIGPEGVLLCDVGGESKGSRVMETVRKLGGDKINYIINTHWHVDHTGGNICFGKEALIIAHENVRKRLSEDKYLTFWEEKHPAFPDYALPDIVFSDRMTMHFNGTDIEIIHLPEGHTDGDAIVYFRQFNILHIGDCLFSNGFPAIDFEMGGSVEGFADNLKKIATLVPPNVTIITGHGPDYTIKKLHTYETMVRSSLNTVRNAMQKGLTLKAMLQANLLKDWEEYSHGFFSCDEWIEMIYQSLLPNSKISSNITEPWPLLTGPYLGQKPPGEKAELFGDGILSTGMPELNSVFFPGGKEVIFSVQCGDMKWALVMTREENGRWRRPEVAPFSGDHGGVDPFVSYDGNRVYFCSNRPLEDGESAKEDYDIWYVDRSGSGWGKPVHMEAPINSDTHEFYPTLTRSGTIYFQSRRPGGIGNSDIYRAELIDGHYVKAECLPEPVNSRGFEGDALIAPDESYIIISVSRGSQWTGADLFISFRTAEGKWTDLVNMGPDINGPGGENCQMLSPCGKYLFFTGRRYNPEKAPATYAGLKARHNASLNGLGDSFWVNAGIIEELKPKEFK